MLKWYFTGFIAALGGSLTYLRRGSPFRPGADTAYELGQLAGAALVPLLIGAVIAGIVGLISKGTPGSFHRRMNAVALIVLVMTVASQFAKIAR